MSLVLLLELTDKLLDQQNKLMPGLALDNPYLDHVHRHHDHHHDHKALDLLHKHQVIPIALYIVALK